jgi:hypothetical protein
MAFEAHANTLRIQSIEQCFGDKGIPLEKKGRILIGDGVLTVIGKKSHTLRRFFLFNDLLVGFAPFCVAHI